MKTRQILISVLAAATPLVLADESSFRQNAGAALDQLQRWYNPSAGLWDTTGWWQSANALTALLNLAAMDGTVKNNHIGVIANTFNNAPAHNPSMVKMQSNIANVPPKTFYAFHDGQDASMPMTWNNTQRLASLELRKRESGFLNAYYDDEGWWALAWINAFDVTGDGRYLDEAKAIFNDMAASWPTPCGGGIFWDRARTYISTISNELFFHLAASLGTRASGGERDNYANWTRRIWAWFQSSGLINGQGTLNDGLGTNCKNNGGTVWSYNQGQIIGGLVEMHALTGDASLLTAASRIADAAIAQLAPQGILHDVCEPNCGADGSQFKGVFMRNLRLLQKAAPQIRYYNFIRANARSIWKNDLRMVNSGTQLGINWAAFTGTPDASTQSSALDAINAALYTI